MNEAEKRANDEVVAHLTRERNAARALVRRLRADLSRIERYVLTADPADTQTVAIQARQLIDAQPWARDGA
jgi:hemerythrin-like domain-containing protein